MNNPNAADNLIPYKKGTSGNPKGKPKGTLSMKTVLNNLLDEEIEHTQPNGKVIRISRKALMLEKWIQAGIVSNDPLKDPDWRASNAIMDHIEGKPMQKNELTGTDGEPIKLAITPEYVKNLQQAYRELKESEKKDEMAE